MPSLSSIQNDFGGGLNLDGVLKNIDSNTFSGPNKLLYSKIIY